MANENKNALDRIVSIRSKALGSTNARDLWPQGAPAQSFSGGEQAQAQRDSMRSEIDSYGSSGYGQFEQAARNAGLYDSFSNADLNLARQNPNAGMSILSAKQQWGDAKTDDERAAANRRAEAIRSSYGGYTGGTSGGYYNLNPLSPIQYQDSARTQGERNAMDELIQKMQNPYDPNTDPAYLAYRQQYLREGQRAMQNTLAESSAMTGGRPSSWAMSAASQANNYYAAQLADKIPELYQNAYNRYLQQYQEQAQQYNKDRTFDYGQLTDEVTNQRNMRDEERQNKLDSLNKAITAYQYGDPRLLNEMGIDTSRDINRQILEQQYNTTEWQNQLQKAQAAASIGDYSLLEQMGFNTRTANFDRDLSVAQLLAQYTGDVSWLYQLMRSGGVSAAPAATGGTTGGTTGVSGRSGSGGSSGGSGGGGSSSGGSKSLTAEQIAASRAAKSGYGTVDYTSGSSSTSSGGRGSRFGK